MHVFFPEKRISEKIFLSIDNKSIDAVSYLNFLDQLIDENLSWKIYITIVTNKLSKISGVLHRLKYIYIRNMFWWLYINHCLFHILITALFFGVIILTLFLNCRKKLLELLQIAHILPTLNLF